MSEELPTTGGVRREALIGVAVAGVVLGSVTAGVVEGSTRRAPAPTELVAEPGEADRAPIDEEDPLAPVLEALVEAHAEVHGDARDGRSGGEALPPALRKAINSEPWLKDLRQELHATLGSGALVARDGLTAAGRAVVAFLEGVDAHGFDPAAYGQPALGADLAAFSDQLAGSAISMPAGVGAAGPILLDLLRAGRLDRGAAAVKLAESGATPTEDHVEAIAEALLERRQSPETAAEAAKLDERLVRALLALVLDFEFVKSAGPFDLKRNVEKLSTRKRPRKRLLARTAEIVAAPDVSSALAGLQPPHPMYEPMLAAYAHYRAVAAKGCHAVLNEKWKIRPGDRGDRIVAVQKRLACEGYYDGPEDGHYGESMLAAVKDFQQHHELNDEGFVFKETIRSLNVPLTRRVEQIRLTLQRLRESRVRELDDYYVRVNLPAFELQVVDGGEVVRRHKVIVGTNRLDDDKAKLLQGHINRTELFVTSLYEVISNPDWILPKRVEVGELKKKLEADPEYLTKNGIEKKTLADGKTVYIQRRGEGNVLGKVKFLLEKSRAIYLHDTDDRSLFRHNRRDLSHGCIRVHRALDLAQWILERDGWDPKDVRRSLKAKSVQRGMKLKAPVDVVTEYMTVDIAADGGPKFLTDIYGFDKAYAKGDLPPAVSARWGSPVLRPHWVPRVPEEVVEGWRRAGKRAPHDYDPAKHGGG